MKASLKFREEQKPLIKAEIPLSILGLPFQSGITAGDAKELSLNLATLFDSGPAFRVSYRPNDAFNPFSFVIKTGIGHFGSPNNAPLTMSAEFNLVANSSNSNSSSNLGLINPRFFIHFKPNFGDFCLKKSQSSVISDFDFTAVKSNLKLCGFEDDGEMVEKPGEMTRIPIRETVEGAVRGVEVGAKTVLPVKGGAVMKLRWGVRFPEGFRNLFSAPTGIMAPRGTPVLVLNKIGIEHVAKEVARDVSETGKGEGENGSGSGSESAELAERGFGLKRDIEMMRFENAGLGKALEDLKAEFARKRGGGGGGVERKLVEDEGERGGDHVIKN